MITVYFNNLSVLS